MGETKKYWLKLNKDFLKSPQMKVIRNMPNGKDYIIFYLALMLESIETVGHLRFTSLVPYNAEMLSAVTETNVDIVRSATKIFCELGLMQIFDDGTIFMSYVPEMTGKECESAERVRNYRQKQKMLQCNTEVTKSNDNKEEEEEINKELDKNIYGEFNNVKLTDSEYEKLQEVYGNKFNEAIEKLSSYLAYKGKKYKSHYAVLGKHNWVYRVIMEYDQQETYNVDDIAEEIARDLGKEIIEV